MKDPVAVREVESAGGRILLHWQEIDPLRPIMLLCDIERTLRGVQTNRGFGAENLEQNRRGRPRSAPEIHQMSWNQAHLLNTLRKLLYSAARKILAVFAEYSQRFAELAVVGIRVKIEIRNGFHRRPMPSTLTKKLDSTIWIPNVSATKPGMTIRSVLSGSSAPKWWLRQ